MKYELRKITENPEIWNKKTKNKNLNYDMGRNKEIINNIMHKILYLDPFIEVDSSQSKGYLMIHLKHGDRSDTKM